MQQHGAKYSHGLRRRLPLSVSSHSSMALRYHKVSGGGPDHGETSAWLLVVTQTADISCGITMDPTTALGSSPGPW